MESVIDTLTENLEVLTLGILSSILATISVLLTRLLFLKFISTFPSNKLFNYIKNSQEKCLVYQVRLCDTGIKGDFVTPIPNYSTITPFQIQYEKRKLIPYVLSAEDSIAGSMILNLLGKIGRTENIQIAYLDKDWDNWENPMFLIGGNWKTTRVFQNFRPYYIIENSRFIIKETGQEFFQKNANDDLGLIEKVYNPNTNKPIWIIIGMRGAGNAGAAYCLSKLLGIFCEMY